MFDFTSQVDFPLVPSRTTPDVEHGKVFVGGIPFEVTSSDLKQNMARFGQVKISPVEIEVWDGYLSQKIRPRPIRWHHARSRRTLRLASPKDLGSSLLLSQRMPLLLLDSSRWEVATLKSEWRVGQNDILTVQVGAHVMCDLSH